jgi:23S rRNA pseudouridine1911/1915/1917 synthase
MLSNIPVLYEDELIMVVDKPPGLLTVEAPGHGSRTLTQILNEDAQNNNLPYRLHPCHRLDKETSGLIIYAKGKSSQELMMQLFKNRKISKVYTAFVQGKLDQEKGWIEKAIEGQFASTRFKLVEQRRDFAIVELCPETGRTNQIRIHFKAIGHPLVGESRFAFRKDFSLRAKRVCLHAIYLEFKHPKTGKIVSVRSLLARDMQNFLIKHPE